MGLANEYFGKALEIEGKTPVVGYGVIPEYIEEEGFKL